MTLLTRSVLTILLVALAPPPSRGEVPQSPNADSQAQDRAAIEKLHEQDVAATLSGDTDALAGLWTEDAVRLDQGRQADVGKKAIHAADMKGKVAHPDAQVVKYAPDIRDVTIRDGWAFECGYFNGSYREKVGGEEKLMHAKFLRVLRKQSNGSWRFARVMWNTNE
jgi:ketosteroid isomerase-like protein